MVSKTTEFFLHHIHNDYPCHIHIYPDDHILLFERYTDTDRYLVAVNTRDTVQRMTLPEKLAERYYVNLYTGRNITLGGQLKLQPFEYLILK